MRATVETTAEFPPACFRHAGSVHARIDMAADATLPVTVRATAAWYASGIEWGREQRVGPGDLENLLATFQDLGAPGALLEATRIAARRTREPITIMVPVVWLVADADRHKHVVDLSLIHI